MKKPTTLTVTITVELPDEDACLELFEELSDLAMSRGEKVICDYTLSPDPELDHFKSH